MMASSTAIEALNQALAEFLAVLIREATALAAARTDDLDALSAQKAALSQQVAGHWLTLCRALDLPAESGLVALREHAQRFPVAEFAKLERLCQEAERQNQINGRLIEEQMRRTQAALQILQQSAASHALYGADGRVLGLSNRNRSIDTA